MGEERRSDEGVERRPIEDELIDVRLHFEEAERVAGVGSWIAQDIESGWLVWSKQTYRIFGIDPSEPVTVERFYELVHEDDLGMVREANRATFEEHAPYDIEHRIVRGDGTVRWVHERASFVRAPDGNALRMVGVVRDVTEEHEAKMLRQNYAAIVESSTDAIIGVGRDSMIRTWNAGAERLFGWSATDVVGREMGTVTLPEDMRGEGFRIRDRVFGGETIRGERVRMRKDGRRIVVATSHSPLREGDQVVGVMIVARDVTEQRQMEQQLRHADRLVALGTIAAGIAHEINNPLTYVLQNLTIVEQRLAALESGLSNGTAVEIKDALADARDGAERVRGIVRDLRTFARAGEEEVAVVDVRQAIDSAIKIAGNEVRSRARLRVEVGELPPVRANAARLSQVFVNLLINAAHAMTSGRRDGEVAIVAREDDRRCIVEVSDNGVGIPAEIVERIFDPFFTTKDVGLGTGLGLSICHGIVAGLGGEITVASRPGEGSTFRVWLPAATAQLTSRSSAPPPPSVRVKRARLLVVDDEPRLARIVERTLAPHHDVVSTSDPFAALARIERGERFDAILCDVIMPSLGGADLYDRIRRIDPSQAKRIVFMTGGLAPTPTADRARDASPSNGLGEGNLRLEKPFDAAELLSTVGRVVG